jgi:hypothetical protein
MELGPPLKARDVTEPGWYYLDRPGPPRGYVYIGSDPDDNLYLSCAGVAQSFKMKDSFLGTFYKIPDNPLETDEEDGDI